MSDGTLLKSLIEARSREAFGQIVLRYTRLVYGAAYRQVGPGGLAEEVTQAVFLLLWQRPATVRGGPGLAGWLVNAARLAALAARRQESRRRTREQLVAAMKSQTTSPDDDTPDLSSILDQALVRLSEVDRSAIALRYLQDQSIGQVAAALGVSEAAARKRVTRALGRLRRHFGRSGVVLSSTALGAALVSQATLAPPTALAATIAAAGPIASVAVTALAKGASTMLTLLKLKLTAAVAVAAVVLGTLGIVVHRALAENPAPAVQVPATSTAATSPATEPSAKAAFDALEAKVTTTWAWNRTLTIQGDGSYVFEMQTLETVPGEKHLQASKTPYVAKYRLLPADVQELERLLGATQWLKLKVPPSPPVSDATEYALMLRREGVATQALVIESKNAPPYDELVRLIRRIGRQEELLYAVTHRGQAARAWPMNSAR